MMANYNTAREEGRNDVYWSDCPDQLSPVRKHLISTYLHVHEDEALPLLGEYFGVALSFMALGALIRASNSSPKKRAKPITDEGRFDIRSCSRFQRMALETMLKEAMERLKGLAQKAHVLEERVQEMIESEVAWDAEKIDLSRRIAAAEQKVQELKALRKDEGKANERVMSIINSREQTWLKEKKNLQREIRRLKDSVANLCREVKCQSRRCRNASCEHCKVMERIVRDLRSKASSRSVDQKEFSVMAAVRKDGVKLDSAAHSDEEPEMLSAINRQKKKQGDNGHSAGQRSTSISGNTDGKRGFQNAVGDTANISAKLNNRRVGQSFSREAATTKQQHEIEREFAKILKRVRILKEKAHSSATSAITETLGPVLVDGKPDYKECLTALSMGSDFGDYVSRQRVNSVEELELREKKSQCVPMQVQKPTDEIGDKELHVTESAWIVNVPLPSNQDELLQRKYMEKEGYLHELDSEVKNLLLSSRVEDEFSQTSSESSGTDNIGKNISVIPGLKSQEHDSIGKDVYGRECDTYIGVERPSIVLLQEDMLNLATSNATDWCSTATVLAVEFDGTEIAVEIPTSESQSNKSEFYSTVPIGVPDLAHEVHCNLLETCESVHDRLVVGVESTEYLHITCLQESATDTKAIYVHDTAKKPAAQIVEVDSVLGKHCQVPKEHIQPQGNGQFPKFEKYTDASEFKVTTSESGAQQLGIDLHLNSTTGMVSSGTDSQHLVNDGGDAEIVELHCGSNLGERDSLDAQEKQCLPIDTVDVDQKQSIMGFPVIGLSGAHVQQEDFKCRPLDMDAAKFDEQARGHFELMVLEGLVDSVYIQLQLTRQTTLAIPELLDSQTATFSSNTGSETEHLGADHVSHIIEIMKKVDELEDSMKCSPELEGCEQNLGRKHCAENLTLAEFKGSADSEGGEEIDDKISVSGAAVYDWSVQLPITRVTTFETLEPKDSHKATFLSDTECEIEHYLGDDQVLQTTETVEKMNEFKHILERVNVERVNELDNSAKCSPDVNYDPKHSVENLTSETFKGNADSEWGEKLEDRCSVSGVAGHNWNFHEPQKNWDTSEGICSREFDSGQKAVAVHEQSSRSMKDGSADTSNYQHELDSGQKAVAGPVDQQRKGQ